MLRTKTLTYIFVILALLFGLIDFVSRAIIMRSVFDMEREESLEHMARVMAAYDNELSRIDSVALDWGYWDDTYHFVSGSNPTYAADNLEGDSGENLRIDYMIFLNNERQFIYGRAFAGLGGETRLSQVMIEAVTAVKWTDQGDPLSGKSGLLLLDGMPVMFAARNVLPSDNRGQARGVILVGRILDVSYLSDIVMLPLEQTLIDDGALPNIAGFGPLALGNAAFVQRKGENTNVTYKALQDLDGVPVILLKAHIQRNLSTIGYVAVRNLRLAFGLFSAVYLLTLVTVLDKTILRRLLRLSARVEQIGQNGDVGQRVEVGSGRDELNALAGNINSMLDGLEMSHHEIADRENRLRLIADNMLDIIFQCDRDGIVRYVTPSFKATLGYDHSELIGKSYISLVQIQDRGRVATTVNGERRQEAVQKVEFRFLHADGREVWVESVGKALYDDAGLFAGGVVCAREIGERKKMEERLRHMSLYDALTGLYNRASFEEAMQLTGRSEKAALIVCDVDGLKLINDTWGHEAGDKFLKVVASIIRHSFRDDDFVARIGGDEFAILLDGYAAQNVAEAVRRLRTAVDSHNRTGPDIAVSLSLGFASTVETPRSDLFKVADDTMYREKLHRRQSVRSNSINILSKALEARDFITEGHAERLRWHVAMMGEELGLPEHRIKDLCLLAQFHDIGKVGVPDSILFKKAALDPLERNEMQKHSEIGYRIAFSSPDLTPIADWILKHHEWWNGNGYPFGLAQEEIPLECRILAIADAYDAMTNDRPYRKALTHEAALIELKSNAGKQFDPYLVNLFIEKLDSLEGQPWATTEQCCSGRSAV